MKLENKVSIVTGGADGIGKSIAGHFLAEGAIVYIFDVNMEAANKTLAEFSNRFGKNRIFFKKIDITDEEKVEAAISDIVDSHGKLDILVNNAGITADNLIMRMKKDDWQKVIDVNLTGAFLCSKHALKSMMRNRSGKIVNISSIVGVRGNAGQCNYSASKAGLIGLTKSLAREVASRNIMVNAIAPGYISTRMTEKLDEGIKEKLIASIPTGKLGTAEDVARSAIFLASSDSDYITGTVLSLDGGMGI